MVYVGYMCSTVQMQRSEVSSVELLLSLHFHMAQAIRLVGQVFHLLSYIADPDLCILIVALRLLSFPGGRVGSSRAQCM